jgi:hypothetical protein
MRNTEHPKRNTCRIDRAGHFLILRDDSEEKHSPHPTYPIRFHGNLLTQRRKSHAAKIASLYRQIMPKTIYQNGKVRTTYITVEPEILVDARYSQVTYLKSPNYPFYFYPTVSDKKLYSAHPSKSPPIKEFVLASCLFGASIMGYEPKNECNIEKSHPLVDHKLEVEDFIDRVKVDRCEENQIQLHPYETMMFAAFDRLIPIMRDIAGAEARVRYHVPDKDYMLYGIRLYIECKISYRALNQYIKAVRDRGNLHRRIISAIAEKHKMPITIESPFDNLCEPGVEFELDDLLEVLALNDEQTERIKRDYTNLYKMLIKIHARTSPNNSNSTSPGDSSGSEEDTSSEERDSVSELKQAINSLQSYMATLMSDEDQAETDDHKAKIEKLQGLIALYQQFFVENLLKKLGTKQEDSSSPHQKELQKKQENDLSPRQRELQKKQEDDLSLHQKTWEKIIQHLGDEKPSELSGLFKLANIAVLAFANNQPDRKNFEVCSMLPVDEKPISKHYSDILSSQFGHIVSLLWLPPLLSEVNSLNDRRFHKYNLFRFRSMDHALNRADLNNQLQDLLGLTKDFSHLLENNMTNEVTEPKIAVAESSPKRSVSPSVTAELTTTATTRKPSHPASGNNICGLFNMKKPKSFSSVIEVSSSDDEEEDDLLSSSNGINSFLIPQSTH